MQSAGRETKNRTSNINRSYLMWSPVILLLLFVRVRFWLLFLFLFTPIPVGMKQAGVPGGLVGGPRAYYCL